MNKSQLEGIVDEAKATYEDLKSDAKAAEERTIQKHSLFMFDMDVERLKITPGFNQDKWPTIADIT